MKKEKITCIGCHLPLDANTKKCPYCGKEISDEERGATVEPYYEAEHRKKSRKLHNHTIFYLIALGLEALCLIGMILPCESTYNLSAFFYMTKSTQFTFDGKQIVIGANAPLIVFIFIIVALLNSAAIFWSLRKKSPEVTLFSYFTAFYGIVIGVVSFIGNIMMSNNTSGNAATKFAPGIGFYVIAVFALAAAAVNIIAVIKYKKFLYSGPRESFKLQK